MSSALSAFSGYDFRVVLVGSQRRGLFHRLQRRKTTGHVKLQGGATLSSSSTSEFVRASIPKYAISYAQFE